MKVVPVDPNTYGKFHTGDSYIVLSVSGLATGYVNIVMTI